MARRRSEGTPAIRALEAACVRYTVHTYDLEDGEATYGQRVASALGVAPDRLYKTLVSEVDGEPVIAVVPVSSRLAEKALARAMGGKRAMLLEPAKAERLTGYVTGGISPFGQRRRLPVILDAGARAHDTLFVSAGRRGLQVEVEPGVLVELLDARLADLVTS